MISRAELAAMPRVTPTGLAEQRYAASKRAFPIGPAGLQVPPSRFMFRPTVDGALLDKIGRTAMGAHERQVLDEASIAMTTARLLADVAGRMPSDHMAILELYGCASMRSTLIVDLPDYVVYRLPIQPRLLVGEGHRFTMVVASPGAIAPIPEATRPFFDLVHGIEVEKTAMRIKLAGWPSAFRRRTGNWPQWANIEEAWPIIGFWLAEQRGQMAKAAA